MPHFEGGEFQNIYAADGAPVYTEQYKQKVEMVRMNNTHNKYDDDIVNLVKFVKGNTNSMQMDFQKTASILFYVKVRYVSVCYNNLRNDDETIDRTGHERPPIIVKQHLILVVEQHLVIAVE
jgi:hypothetical protein